MLEATKRVITSHKGRGLVTGFIYGKYAHGKTSYLLHIAMEVFQKLLHLKNVDAWLMALDHLYFHPVEALMFVEVYRTKYPNERVPVLGMDDVGQHIPRARWWREDVVQFREWMTVARTDVSAVFFTGPTQLSLPGGVIDSCFLRIHVRRHPEKRNMSIAKAYEVSVSPYFQINVRGPVFMDEFPRHYPNFVFDEYQKMRENMVAPLRRNLLNMMDEDELIEKLHGMKATQQTIGAIVGKTQQAISAHLKKQI